MKQPEFATEVDALCSWQQLNSARDEDIPLLWAALLIAKDEYPDLDVHAASAPLEEWCKSLRERVDNQQDNPLEAVQALNEFVFDEQGFAGNDEDYYDPRNSYLNEVIERKLGNPISLAIVQLELANRLGLPMRGVSFPGHFLLRFPVDDGMLILDPYHKGRSLDVDELKLRASSHISGRKIGDEQLGRMLEPAPNKVILIRMLRNLKQLYIEREDFPRALRNTDRLVFLDPSDAEEIRDRGKLYAHIGHFSAASEDFKQYLAMQPEASDANQVWQWLVELSATPQKLN